MPRTERQLEAGTGGAGRFRTSPADGRLRWEADPQRQGCGRDRDQGPVGPDRCGGPQKKERLRSVKRWR